MPQIVSLGGGGIEPKTIIMYSGNVPPAGWALCNGSNGTPNMTSLVVRGVLTDGGNGVRQTGTGSSNNSHTHFSSNVGGTAMPLSAVWNHRHDIFSGANGTGHPDGPSDSISSGNSNSYVRRTYTNTQGSGGSHAHTASINASVNHTHTASIQYQRLAFIMKLP